MVTTYSRCFLTRIGAESSNIKLKSTLWRNLCNIGISRVKPTRRGCRAGQRKQGQLQITRLNEESTSRSLSSPNGTFLTSNNFDDWKSANLHSSLLNIPIFYTNFFEEDKQRIPVRITTHRHNSCGSRGTTPIVQEKYFSMPAWSSSTVDSKRKSLDLCLLNARSVRNKTLAISDFTTDLNIDIVALTETWLNSDDEAFITELYPEGFKFIHAPRNNNRRGGGVGLLFKNNHQMKEKLCDSFLSFECMDILLLNLINVRIFVIYRPPPSQVNGLSVSSFFCRIFSIFGAHCYSSRNHSHSWRFQPPC